MSWAIGFDEDWTRDIGYGVPATCDYPVCGKEIHRGLSYVCGSEPYGGEHGCGLYFCGEHRAMCEFINGEVWVEVCERCADGKQPFQPTPDVKAWVEHKLTDDSWAKWRQENPELVKKMESVGAGLTNQFGEPWIKDGY